AGAEAPPGQRAFFVRVSNEACTTCHRGPTHHDNQASAPACATCHVEHKGRPRLAALDDRQCTQCHGDLKTKPGTTTKFETRIVAFSGQHPEFAVPVGDRRVRLDHPSDVKDSASVALNHQKHLKVGLKGLAELRTLRGSHGIAQTSKGLQLSCGFCHETDASRATIQPISYAKHCGPACHELDFDSRFPGVATPHDTPTIVHGFLKTLFIEAFEQCQLLGAAGAPAPSSETLGAQCRELGLITKTQA